MGENRNMYTVLVTKSEGRDYAEDLDVDRRAQNTDQNLNTVISIFLIYETGIPVLIPVFQIQRFFSIKFDDRCNDARKKQVIT
jgi:hypothetical protein